MAHTEGGEAARPSESQKLRPSPDRSLQLDSLKLESLVIPDQHAGVNAFPGLVPIETAVYGRTDDWGEVVTR